MPACQKQLFMGSQSGKFRAHDFSHLQWALAWGFLGSLSMCEKIFHSQSSHAPCRHWNNTSSGSSDIVNLRDSESSRCVEQSLDLPRWVKLIVHHLPL